MSDYQTINELVWCSMKRLNFRLGTKSCNGQTFAKPEFIPISGYPVARSDNVKTGKPHGVSFAGEPIVDTTSLAPHNGNAAMNKKQRVLHIVGKISRGLRAQNR